MSRCARAQHVGLRGATGLPRPAAQAVELREAARNPLLGQFHLEAGGRFVSATVAPPPREGAGGAARAGQDAGAGFGPRTPRGGGGREAGAGRGAPAEELDWDAAEGEGSGLGLGDLPNPQGGGGSGGGACSPAHSPRAAQWPPHERIAATGA